MTVTSDDNPRVPGPQAGGYRVSLRTVAADWPALVVWLLVTLAGALAYRHLPAQVPSHWNFRGEVDAYASRAWAVVAMPLTTLGIYGLMLVLPLVDPRRQNYALFAGSYRTIRLAVVTVLTAIQAIVLVAATGRAPRVDLFVPALLGVLFMVLGNVMGQVRHNYFVGIRTPWTLASERVWRRTHRVGGYAFVGAGLVGLASLLLPPAFRILVFMAALFGAVGFATVYSYLAYREEQRQT